MDMSLGLRGATTIDDPSWQLPTGQASPNRDPRSPESGQLSGRLGFVAPDWLDRLSDFLRRKHPAKTADAVAARCRGQISAEQVRKWLKRRSAPSGIAMLWLATCYGPELLQTLYGPSPVGLPGWLDKLIEVERADLLGARLQALRAELDTEIARSRR